MMPKRRSATTPPRIENERWRGARQTDLRERSFRRDEPVDKVLCQPEDYLSLACERFALSMMAAHPMAA
jgi:hypothetical protein